MAPQMRHGGVARAWCPTLHLLLLTWSLSRGGVEGLTELKIGALLSFNSTIGEIALAALQRAVRDVNANSSILREYELKLIAVDTSCDAFQGAAAAVEVWKEDVVAVAGPQTSSIGQFAADVGAATQVPIISFAATDPALTSTGNRYFLRTIHSDMIQMKCLAAFITLYGWKKVSYVSTEDSVGLNSLAALSDALDPLDASVVYKRTIPRDANAEEMVRFLNGLAKQESRVIVVHLQPSLGRLLFTSAQSMSMMDTGFVWLMSEAMSSSLGDMSPSDSLWTAIEGVVAVRSYVPSSAQLSALQSRWNTVEFRNSSPSTTAKHLNIYGMHAYDSVWVIAQAMDHWIRSGKNFTFASRAAMTAGIGGGTDLANLKILQDGDSFLKTIRDTRFWGTSGLIEFDSGGDSVGSAYEILNLIGNSPHGVGFWNVQQGFSTVLKSNSSIDRPDSPAQLQNVTWPGGSTQVPKGSVVTKRLLIGVPFKTDFTKLVGIFTNSSNVTTVSGYCIEIFEELARRLAINFTYVPYGGGAVDPSYDALVDKVADKTFDAAVGDITLTTKRSEKVAFTEPYSPSGLVVAVTTKAAGSNHAWAFLRPFTPQMWVAAGVFFLLTGLAMWILEFKKSDEFRGRPMKQIVTVLWFMFSTLFFMQRERTRSNLGMAVLTMWFFVVLIVVSSYQANLTSIVTVQQLMPTVQGIDGLVSSNLKIGYQVGSFAKDHLLREMNVASDRLIPLEDQAAYASALATGLVGGIVNELPYVQMFLSNNCPFTMVGRGFTKDGWGFAFPKGSQLALDMSAAIQQIREDGTLQKITDTWLSVESCGASAVSSGELGLSTFWVLFVITGTASIICVIFHFARLIWQHHRDYIVNILARSSRNRQIPNFPSSVHVNSSKEMREIEMGSQE